MTHINYFNPDDETFRQFITRAKRELRKMSAISVDARPFEHSVEVKFLAPNGSHATITYRTGN